MSIKKWKIPSWIIKWLSSKSLTNLKLLPVYTTLNNIKNYYYLIIRIFRISKHWRVSKIVYKKLTNNGLKNWSFQMRIYHIWLRIFRDSFRKSWWKIMILIRVWKRANSQLISSLQKEAPFKNKYKKLKPIYWPFRLEISWLELSYLH